LRSKIRDNRDEYIGGKYGNIANDTVTTDIIEQKNEFLTPEAMEAQALIDLAKMGVNPIQHPGGSPLLNPFNIGVIATISAYNIARWADGSWRGDPLDDNRA
jgi:hypothetical protein